MGFERQAEAKGSLDDDPPGDTGSGLDPGHGRHPNRRASVHRRRRGRRDRERRLRPPGPRPRDRRVPALVPGRVDAGDPPRISRRRRRRRRRPAVLGPDGLALAVFDRERGHRLLPQLRRPQRRAYRLRSPAGHPRAGQRHVVPLGHRRRSSRPGPRRGRTLPPGRAGLRRAPPRGRLPGRPLDHERRLPPVPRVHGGQRPGPDGGEDQAGHEDLPVRAGDLRDHDRELPGRRGTAEAAHRAQSAQVHRGHGQGDEHAAAERFLVLRAARRARAVGAGVGARPRDRGSRAVDRNRQGQGVQARRAHAQDPRGGGGARQCDRAHDQHPGQGRRGLRLLRRRSRFELVQPAVRRRLQLDGSAAGDHAGWRQALSDHRRAGLQLADRLLLHRDRGLPVDVHALDGHRLAVPDDLHGLERGGPRRRATTTA